MVDTARKAAKKADPKAKAKVKATTALAGAVAAEVLSEGVDAATPPDAQSATGDTPGECTQAAGVPSGKGASHCSPLRGALG